MIRLETGNPEGLRPFDVIAETTAN